MVTFVPLAGIGSDMERKRPSKLFFAFSYAQQGAGAGVTLVPEWLRVTVAGDVDLVSQVFT